VNKWIAFLMVPFFSACVKFPSNPSKDAPPAMEVFVEFVEAKYIPLPQKVDGLVADKMNVLTFKFRTLNCETAALEFMGTAVLEGPPDGQEHNLSFRTDRLDVEASQNGLTWNVLRSVKADTPYTLARCKIPMNEYEPFNGDQGKVRKVTIHQVWAIDAAGNRVPVKIVE
jgi:hypothetical protein